MKAIVCTRYGPPDVLQLREVVKPVPKSGEMLIKVVATAVTASDCIIRGFKLPRWSPLGLMMGLVVGFRRPRQPILGMVLAGDVQSVGKEVKSFNEGDPVYGSTFRPPHRIRFGAYAEYVCLPEDSLLALKPPNVTYEEAAAVPYGSGLALHFLKKGSIQSGQRVLVYGASGAIGTAAVQLARHFGAQVTGVCSTRNAELVRSLGADTVIDYTKQDSLDDGDLYDLVLDAVGERKRSPLKAHCRKALTPDGQYVSVDDGNPQYSAEGLALLTSLLAAGKLRPVIDRSYPLQETAQAHAYVDRGHKTGNVVISVAQTEGATK